MAVAVVVAVLAFAACGDTSSGRPVVSAAVTTSAACSDGVDNDGDGLTDFAGHDPGCSSASDRAEKDRGGGGGGRGPACSDGRDNDGDGLTDFAGHDPECSSASDPAEKR
jgi:hypothetical protein